jgi:hypothetical protein
MNVLFSEDFLEIFSKILVFACLDASSDVVKNYRLVSKTWNTFILAHENYLKWCYENQYPERFLCQYMKCFNLACKPQVWTSYSPSHCEIHSCICCGDLCKKDAQFCKDCFTRVCEGCGCEMDEEKIRKCCLLFSRQHPKITLDALKFFYFNGRS